MSLYPERRPWRWLLAAGFLAFAAASHASTGGEHPTATGQSVAVKANSDSTADHTKFKELKGPFADGPAVTKACLSCHTEAGKQVMDTIHWTWEYKSPNTGQKLGKKHLVNTFCTNARGNEGMCAQCHAGYGWKDESFDFSNQDNVDCLVCHDGTGGYYKLPPTTGNKACGVMFEGLKPIDFSKVAKNVDATSRQNCGACHFFGGGGDGVKHGDLDSSLLHPGKQLDVHMNEKGLDFTCTECHRTKAHEIAGSHYDMLARDTKGIGKPGEQRHAASCEVCHDNSPHESDELLGIKLNDHVAKVACETCHIPAFARGGVATKVDWDWRTAGKTRDGAGYSEEGYVQGNGEHRHTYRSIKGNFKWGENVEPYYAWFDGVMKYTTIDTKFDPANAPIEVNALGGSADDPNSRIWPFKRMHTVQPYDKVNNTLVYTYLWGDDKEAYWGNYDFGKAIKHAMDEFKLPYSGEYGFIETYSYWPINHMVAPKREALHCSECHAADSRLAGIKGIYLPGYNSHNWLDILGMLMVFGSLIGVFGHAFIRFCCRKKKGGQA